MHNPIKKRLRIQLRAFSLVEILVVLGLFSGISTLALGSLFNAQAINARLQETQAILDNVNLSLQSFSREIRFGSDFYCATTLPAGVNPPPYVRKNCVLGGTGGTVLIFQPADAINELDRVGYYVSNGILYKKEYRFGQAYQISQMTTSEVKVEVLQFFVDGANTASGVNDEGGAMDFKQPLISLIISGKSIPQSSTKLPIPFRIQMHISARELDNI